MSESWPCKTCGSKEHPVLVFLHGFLGNGAEWEFLQKDFEKNYYCIFPDLPGHGANLGILPDRALTFGWMAHGLARTLEQLEISSVHLVGYSLGGRLALYFATAYPGRVISLTLESASPGLAGKLERRERRQLDAQRALEIRNLGLAAFLDSWYQMPLFASLRRQPERLAGMKARRLANDPQEIARVVSELSPGCQPSLWGKLTNIQTAVLLLAGSFDEKYLALVRLMADRLPASKVSMAPKAGHNIHLEAPEWYIQELQDFLSTLA
ncbi:MAG: 2-succinyl-6-hydroxy-2,4-cyclohexadiene-1-carboxylate synthase [Chloroflexi bacterium]|nr:2-succinyl-6-hydroxy-2,4-cyclohexadiene-1-carboxylate synthase [Chloroflexota bacterium]